ncbi:MAG TPA: redoxin domain-containing protein [Atribacteraceae bacterium]|nr:redoxin domain-containing protein [Atribacteraceae bacterium]
MKKRRWFIAHALIVGIWVLFLLESPPVLSQEWKAPDFVLPSLEGDRHRLEDYRGRPVAILFFTTWCPFCAQELPALEQFYRESSENEGLAIFAVNVQERSETVRSMVTPLNISYPVLMDQTGQTAMAYRMVALPSTYFIDPQGNLQDMVIGATNPRAFEEKLNQILWYRGVDDQELATLMELTTSLQILDFRTDGENPYSDLPTVRHHVIRDLGVALSHFAPDGVYLILTDHPQESLTIAREMALAGFRRIFYRLAGDREG